VETWLDVYISLSDKDDYSSFKKICINLGIPLLSLTDYAQRIEFISNVSVAYPGLPLLDGYMKLTGNKGDAVFGVVGKSDESP
jgi:hypothetical protein